MLTFLKVSLFFTALAAILAQRQITNLWSSTLLLNNLYTPTPQNMSQIDPNFVGSGNLYTIGMWVNHDSSWNNANDIYRIAMRISNSTNPTQDTGTGRVFLHMTNLQQTPYDSPIVAASTNDITGTVSASGWDSNTNFPANSWLFFAYSVNITSGQQYILHMAVTNPSQTPYTLLIPNTNQGLYQITPSSMVYIGSDLTGNPYYQHCFCKVIANLYSNLFITDLNGLMALTLPEMDFIQDIWYYGGGNTFSINNTDITNTTEQLTATKGDGSHTGWATNGGFNLFSCVGQDILTYLGSEDLTTGVYVEFMVRASASSPSAPNTIFVFQGQNGTNGNRNAFFRIAYNNSNWQIYVELFDNTMNYHRLTNPSAISPGYWSTVKVLLFRQYYVGYSYYTLSIDVDGVNGTTLSMVSANSPGTYPYTLSSYFDSTSNIQLTWCAEYSGGSSTINFAFADIAMFRLVKSPGPLYQDFSIVPACQSIIGLRSTILFCETCQAGYNRAYATGCVSTCPDNTIPLDDGQCGNLGANVMDETFPCNDTSQCVLPLRYCNLDYLLCNWCTSNAECSGHPGYTKCLNYICRGTRNLAFFFNVTNLTFVITPDSPFFLVNPPISDYINLTVNGQSMKPLAVNNSDDYSVILVSLDRSKLKIGLNTMLVTIDNLTESTSEAAILLTPSPITYTWLKPQTITYDIFMYEWPQVFYITFNNYSFDTVTNLRQYLFFNFSGYYDFTLGVNDTTLNLLNGSVLEVYLNKTVNESIYEQQLTVDMSLWNAANSSSDPDFDPYNMTADINVSDLGWKIFIVSRTAQISAIGTAAFCFLVDLSMSCQRSSYVRFYAMTERISILRYINIYYHPITIGFFEEMDLDLSSMPYFFTIITNSSALHPERNITILNQLNYIGYDNVFLQGYGGTALLQGITIFAGAVVAFVDWIMRRKRKHRTKLFKWNLKLKKIVVYNLILQIFFATVPKLVLGLSIFFQNANTGSSYASGSFATGILYLVGFITIILILLRNAKNEKDKTALRFFAKIEILRHDYKDSRPGRAAPLVFTAINCVTAIFTGAVQASGQAQAAMLAIFPTFAVIYWVVTKGLVKRGELILMIYSETCFALAGLMHCILSNSGVSFSSRLTIGYAMMGIYLLMIWGNMVYRAGEFFVLIRAICSKKKVPTEKGDQYVLKEGESNVNADPDVEDLTALDADPQKIKKEEQPIEEDQLPNISFYKDMSVNNGLLNTSTNQFPGNIQQQAPSQPVKQRNLLQDFVPKRQLPGHFGGGNQPKWMINQIDIGRVRQTSESNQPDQSSPIRAKRMPRMEGGQRSVNRPTQIAIPTTQIPLNTTQAISLKGSTQDLNLSPTKKSSQDPNISPVKNPMRDPTRTSSRKPTQSKPTDDMSPSKKKPEQRRFVLNADNDYGNNAGELFKKIKGEGSNNTNAPNSLNSTNKFNETAKSKQTSQ